MTPRRRFRTALLTMLVLIGGIWGLIAGLGLEPRLGLDLQGGISVVLTADGSADSGSIDKAVDIIRNRVDALGVAEPDISRQGNNVLVQLPGVEERQAALELIGRTAQLRFRTVLEVLPAGSEPVKAATPPDCTDALQLPRPDDPTKEVVHLRADVRHRHGSRASRPSSGTSCGSGPRRSAARTWPARPLEPPSTTGGSFTWSVSLNLTGEGATKFTDVTGKLACNPGRRPEASARDRARPGRRVPSRRWAPRSSATKVSAAAPRRSPATSRRTRPTELALVLRYGALPVSFEPSTFTTVSPTLGKESLNGGLIAAMIGLGIVFIYVAFFYRFLGLLIWLGILLHAGFTFGVVIILGRDGRVRAHAGRHRRAYRVVGHRRGLVHRLLRAAQGRGP